MEQETYLLEVISNEEGATKAVVAELKLGLRQVFSKEYHSGGLDVKLKGDNPKTIFVVSQNVESKRLSSFLSTFSSRHNLEYKGHANDTPHAEASEIISELNLRIEGLETRLQGTIKENRRLSAELRSATVSLPKAIGAYPQEKELYFDIFRQREVPKLEAMVQKFNAVIGAFEEAGIGAERIAYAFKIRKTPIAATPEYRELAPQYNRVKELVELAKTNPYVEIKPEGEAIISRMEELKKIYSACRQLANQFVGVVKGDSVRFLITNSSDNEHYVVSITTPIVFRTDYKNSPLEASLLQVVEDELASYAEAFNGSFARIENNGIFQYNFKLPKSQATAEDVMKFITDLQSSIFNSQTDYMPAQLGIRINFATQIGTDDFPLEEVILKSEKVDVKQPRYTVPDDIKKLYSSLAVEARNNGVNISDDPLQFGFRPRNPEYTLLIPLTLKIAASGAKREQIIEEINRLFPKFGIPADRMSVLDYVFKVLKKQDAIEHDRSTHNYTTSKSYMNKTKS